MTLLSTTSPILMELEVYLVTIDINGINGQLIAFHQIQRGARGNSSLIIIVYQDLENLLVREDILVVGFLEEDIINGVWGVKVSSEVLLGHEADDIEGSPIRIFEVILLSSGGVGNAIRLEELVTFGYGCGQFFSLDVIIKIVVEAGKVICSPGCAFCGDLPSDFDSVDRPYYHRGCQ